jgi:outer membrane receptor protein involved in Fe transport
LVIRHYDDFYSDWDVFSRTNEELDAEGNNIQAWKTPAYTVMDLHANYNVPVDMGNARLSVFAHIFNLADAVYIQDATDNSRYNAFDKDHDADDAEVFLGLPRNFNAGFRVSF